MRIYAAVSTERNSQRAAEEVATQVKDGLEGDRPDLAMLFVSYHHASAADLISDRVATVLRPHCLTGCASEAVIAGEKEYDGDRPAVSLWAAILPSSEIEPLRLRADESPEGLRFRGLPELGGDGWTLLLFCDPFSFPADEFLQELAKTHPDVRCVGGMAGAARVPGGNRLFLNGEVFNDGAVGVGLRKGVRVHAIVSQGCRPFGRPLVVTKASEKLIFELGGAPAIQKLAEQAKSLEGPERELLGNGLHVGRAVDASRVTVTGGDYLVRNVLGCDMESGALVVGDNIRPGQTIRFHLRDPAAASRELEELVERVRKELPAPPAGLLLFTCNGRGRRLFGVPDHDASRLARGLGGVPCAGFFAAGEIGPVGRENHLHGFTAVAAVFAPEGPARPS